MLLISQNVAVAIFTIHYYVVYIYFCGVSHWIVPLGNMVSHCASSALVLIKLNLFFLYERDDFLLVLGLLVRQFWFRKIERGVLAIISGFTCLVLKDI